MQSCLKTVAEKADIILFQEHITVLYSCFYNIISSESGLRYQVYAFTA